MSRSVRVVTYEEILGSVVSGKFDDRLSEIIEVCKERRDYLGKHSARSLKPGDKVRIVQDIRPTYLGGLEAVVERVNQTTVSVRFEEPDKTYARRYGSGVTRLPLNLVDWSSSGV